MRKPSSNIHVQTEIQLPNELLSIIIDELASDSDIRTLAALASCRLASHALCSLVTPLFFSSIALTGSLDSRHYRDRVTKLNQLLTRTTHDIATSVHTLTLRYDKGHLMSPRNGTLISEILRRLPHIRNFTLKCTSYFDFSLVTEELSSAIQALCRSPKLTTLDLGHIRDFPITIITPNLRRLRLTCSTFCVNCHLFCIFCIS
jgi:hypothetical protein